MADLSKLNHLVSLARTSFANDNYTKAVEYCDSILKSDLENADAWDIKIRCASDWLDQANLLLTCFSTTSNVELHRILLQTAMKTKNPCVQTLNDASAPLHWEIQVANTLQQVDNDLTLHYLKRLFQEILVIQEKTIQDLCSELQFLTSDYRNAEKSDINNASFIHKIDSILPKIQQLFLFAMDHEYDIVKEMERLQDAWVKYLNDTENFELWDGDYHVGFLFAVSQKTKIEIRTLLSKIAAVQEETQAYRLKFSNQYWEFFPEQKADLDQKIQILRIKIFKLDRELAELETHTDLDQLQLAITRLEYTRSNLSRFSIIQKMAITKKISALENQRFECKEISYRKTNAQNNRETLLQELAESEYKQIHPEEFFDIPKKKE